MGEGLHHYKYIGDYLSPPQTEILSSLPHHPSIQNTSVMHTYFVESLFSLVTDPTSNKQPGPRLQSVLDPKRNKVKTTPLLSYFSLPSHAPTPNKTQHPTTATAAPLHIMMPRRVDPASLPGAPDVAPALVGLGVAAATAAGCDRVDGEPEVADDSGGDDAVASALVIIGVEEEEGVVLLLPAAVALMLRLTPALSQICCAKAMTSAETRIDLGQYSSLERASMPVLFFSGGDFGACTFLKKREGGPKKKYTLVKSSGGHCFSAPASALSMKVLSLHRHLKSLD